MNAAAERLRASLADEQWDVDLFDEALAAERRATVERIKNDLGLDDGWEQRTPPVDLNPFDVRAILDKEAAR